MTIAAVIGLLAALVLAVRALASHRVSRTRLMGQAVIWVGAFVVLALGLELLG